MSESGVSLGGLWISLAAFKCKCSNTLKVDGEQDPQIEMQYVMLATIPLKYISSSTLEGRPLKLHALTHPYVNNTVKTHV